MPTLQNYAAQFPVIGIVGPRQVGKTTLAKIFAKSIERPVVYLDLERPSDADKLQEAELYLGELQDACVIIDEVQRKPDLFPLLRSLVDDNRKPLRFIILGSASPDLLRESSETLAGRIAYLELAPFNYAEIAHLYSLQTHHFFGGFPEALLAKTPEMSKTWLDSFIATYIERDLPLLGLNAAPQLVRKLWEMLAWQNGNTINFSNIGRSLGLTHKTVAKYVQFLTQAYMVNTLPPFYYNIKKRLVKSPKILLRDTGILHRLLRIDSFDQLSGTPLIGNSWEAYVAEQIRSLKHSDIDLFFYRTQTGSETDLLLTKGLRPIAAIEIKYTSTPKLTKSLLTNISDLGTEQNFILTPASDDYPIHKMVRVCSLHIFLRKYLNQIF